MILEGIVTTISADGVLNIAPMGPRVGASMDRFVLRPFHTAQTYRNLRDHGEGVLHVTDDVLLLARAAVGQLDPLPEVDRAEHVHGYVLRETCRYYEFRVLTIDDRTERVTIEAQTVHCGRQRDFFGFNRAKHAVVEAAIIATRITLLPAEEIADEYRRLAVLVEKTGGEQEHAAFRFLSEYVEQAGRVYNKDVQG
jgi:uncharacterized protein